MLLGRQTLGMQPPSRHYPLPRQAGLGEAVGAFLMPPLRRSPSRASVRGAEGEGAGGGCLCCDSLS